MASDFGPVGGGGVLAIPAIGDLSSSLFDLLRQAREHVETDAKRAGVLIARASALLQVEMDRRKSVSAREPHAGKVSTWQRNRIASYLERHLQDTVHVEDLGNAVNLSSAYFARAFKRTFGVSPHAYIVRCRLERACRLMLTTDDPLSDVALACGFTDQAHLSKLFRQSTGESPAAWRRERREPLRSGGAGRPSANRTGSIPPSRRTNLQDRAEETPEAPAAAASFGGHCAGGKKGALATDLARFESSLTRLR
ncbi:MAG: AraC family transcriptional regulator [Rhizomicrobium sp.]